MYEQKKRHEIGRSSSSTEKERRVFQIWIEPCACLGLETSPLEIRNPDSTPQSQTACMHGRRRRRPEDKQRRRRRRRSSELTPHDPNRAHLHDDHTWYVQPPDVLTDPHGPVTAEQWRARAHSRSLTWPTRPGEMYPSRAVPVRGPQAGSARPASQRRGRAPRLPRSTRATARDHGRGRGADTQTAEARARPRITCARRAPNPRRRNSHRLGSLARPNPTTEADQTTTTGRERWQGNRTSKKGWTCAADEPMRGGAIKTHGVLQCKL